MGEFALELTQVDRGLIADGHKHGKYTVSSGKAELIAIYGRISGISSDVCSWRHKSDKSKDEKGKKERGAQIDLLIDRRDGVINLCEMKYANAPFLISSNYMETVKARRELFRHVTKTRKALYLTFATTCGLAPNEQRNDIQSEITLDDLFVE